MSGNKNSGFAQHPENISKKGSPADAWTWAGLYKQYADELDENGTPYKVRIVQRMLRQAAKGDVSAVKEISNRTDGMPKQVVDINDTRKQIEETKKYIDEKIQSVDGDIPQELSGTAVSDDSRPVTGI